MPDNSTEIAHLQALLNSGADSITVDGVTTKLDHSAIARRLRELRATDTTDKNRRPVISTIDLSTQ